MLSGCQSINVDATNAAQLRVITASPDAPAQDIYQNRTPLLAYNLGFGTVGHPTCRLAAGTYTLSAAKAQHLADTGFSRRLSSAARRTVHGNRGQYRSGEYAGNYPARPVATSPRRTGLAAVRPSGHTRGCSRYLSRPTWRQTGSHVAGGDEHRLREQLQLHQRPRQKPMRSLCVPAGTTPIPATVTLHTGAQVSYVSGSAHTVVLIDQPVATTPSVQTVVTDDYEQ